MPTVTTVTGGWQFVNPPKYYEESASTYASLITTANASGVFGKVKSITVEVNPNTNEFRGLGSEDVYTQVIGRVGVRARIAFGLVNTSSVFLNYASKLDAQAAGDISRSIHVVWSQRTSELGSTFTSTYFALQGVRPNTLRITGRAGEPLTAECELLCHSFTYTTVASAFQSTFAAEPTDAVWNYQDGGANPVTWQGRSLDTTDFEFTINRELSEIYVLGASNVTFLPHKNRGITGTFTDVFESSSTYADVLTATSGTLGWVMKTGAGTFSGASTVIINHSLPLDIAGETYEKYNFKSGTVAAF